MRSRLAVLAVPLALAALVSPGGTAAAQDIASSLQLAPLQARSATPVMHTLYVECRPWDPACAGFTFAWDFGAGTFAESGAPLFPGSQIEHTYGAAGLHRWAVRGPQGQQELLMRTLSFATHDENWAPAMVEAFTMRPDYAVTGRAFRVDAYARDDSPAAGWTWGVDTDGDEDFDDAAVSAGGPFAYDGVVADVTFGSDGTHVVKVRMSDGQGASTTAAFDVRTHTANEPPQTGVTISGQSSPATVPAGTVNLWAEGDFDDYTATDQLVHSWTLDGQPVAETGSYFTRTFSAGGHHTVEVTVTDGGGLSTKATGEFDVVADSPAPAPGTFSVYDDPAAGTDGLRALQNIRLDISDSLASLPDAQLAWDLDGDGAYDDDLGRQSFVSYPADGEYEVGLRAGDPAGTPTTVRRTLIVGRGRTDASGGQPVTPQPSPPSAAAPAAIVPLGRRLLTAGPIVLTDGVGRGTRAVPGRNAPGINLQRRTLVLGTLFAARAARVQATASARLRGRASAAGSVSLGRATISLAANSSRVLTLRPTRSVTRRLRGLRRLSVTTRLTVTEPGRRPVTRSRLATLKIVPR